MNAAELDAKYSPESKEKPPEIITGGTGFPKYDEYETVVGKGAPKKDS